MFDIEIRKVFSAAHSLRGYNGMCCNLHGHNYSVVVVVKTAKLDDLGLSLDFKVLKEALDDILNAYDHHDLSQLPEFRDTNPSSENLAISIYRQLSARINSEDAKVYSVRVGESENSAVTYYED